MKAGKLLNSLFLSLTILSLVACSETMPRSRWQDGLAGAGTGAVAGAGTGAIVAGTTSGMSMGPAIAVGAGSGVVVGALAGVAYSAYAEDEVLDKNDEIIHDNRVILDQRQREIDALRQELQDDGNSIRIDRTRGEYIYNGPSFGDPRR